MDHHRTVGASPPNTSDTLLLQLLAINGSVGAAGNNSSILASTVAYDGPPRSGFINLVSVQCMFGLIYGIIFSIGVTGNMLVCYVVCRNRAMHTVTNFFITNLAVSDIMLCLLAVPFTPMYTFMERWIFGTTLCHLVSGAQAVSVYISSLTLTAIAMDRYIVIVYPFRHRMKVGGLGVVLDGFSGTVYVIVSCEHVSISITRAYNRQF